MSIRPAPRRPAVPRAWGRGRAGVLTAFLAGLLILLGAPAAHAAETPPLAPTSSPTPSSGGGGSVEVEEGLPADPLAVTIDTLRPSVLPTSGRLTVAGRVTNRSQSEWTELAVYLVVSGGPLTTADELAWAVTSDPRTDVGDRIVTPGLFITIDDLAPGQSTDYRLSVPASALGTTGQPGVYWTAVHVLGTSEQGRLEGADGRARAFLPYLPEDTAATGLALGVQLRQQVQRTAQGRLVDEDQWTASLGENGGLGRLLRLTATGDDWPLTWVLDPAVVDAVVALGRGNPPLDLAGEPEEVESPGDEVDAERSTGARRAEQWLGLLTDQTSEHPVLRVPYADPDLLGARSAGATALVEAAAEESAALLEDLEVTSAPAVVLPGPGSASEADQGVESGDGSDLEAGLGTVSAATLALAPAASLAEPAGPVLSSADGHRVVVADAVPAVAGPGPNAQDSALAVRQRLLADAALHALSPNRAQPLVRLLPAGWDPGDRWEEAAFFDGLDVSWLRATSLASLARDAPVDGEAAPGPAVPDGSDSDADVDAGNGDAGDGATQPVPASVFRAAEELVAVGGELDELLTVNDVLASEVTRQALTTVSVWAREDRWAAGEQARQARARVRGWLAEVSVRSPSFVTMSSESGTFQVSLVNGLDQPVTVGLEVTNDSDDLELSTPTPVEIGPQGRESVLIEATATDIGIHQVTLQAVSTNGTAVGDPTTLSVRSSNVGVILWVIMAVGGSVLFVAVFVRILLRIRQRRRTHGPLLSPTRGAR